jgi:nicotinamidase-related amidase
MAEKPVEKPEKTSAIPRSPDLMSAADSALFVVDAQVKLLEIIPQRARIVWNIRRLLDAADALRVPISATEQYPERLSPTVPELRERVGKAPNKMSFSACVCGDILDQWRADNRYRVLLCGIETHVCIMQTALDLAAAGFEPYVAVDAVGARYEIDHEFGLRRMESSGVTLTTTEAAMFEWCRTADRAEFKKISALAKESPP